MENNNPKLERYQKVFMYLAFGFILLELGLMMLWTLQVVQFPIFLVFVPMLIANLFATISLWTRVPKPARIALIMTFPMIVACAVILQFNI